MSSPGLTYSVRDRSILLPFYRKLVVNPSLPLIPTRVNPNAITHAGHLINLAGVAALAAFGSARGGWAFIFAAVMLHIYNWCDNADGGHARRTNQCSALGELLDHGLDLLNVAYIGAMTAMSVSAPPIWSVALMLLIPGAAAATYWEQAETGVFELGILNQVESVMSLSAALVVSGLFGTEVFTSIHLGPFSLRDLLLAFVCTGTAANISRTFIRVTRRGGAVPPFLAILSFSVLVFAAAATGALDAPAAIAIGTSGLIFYGMRSLALRIYGKKPAFERSLVVFTLVLAGLCAWKLLGGAPTALLNRLVAIAAVLYFGGLAIIDARASRREVVRLDGQKKDSVASAT